MKRFLALCAAAIAVAPPAAAVVLDFEGILSDSGPIWGDIPDGYGGFSWSFFFRVLDTSRFSTYPSGYHNGCVSSSCVGYNGFADPAGFWTGGETFTLNSLFLTAAWNRDLVMDITGYRNGTVVQAKTVVLDTRRPKLVRLDWSGIDEVWFATSNGTDDPTMSGSGRQAAFDDIRINEPTAVPVVPGPAAALPFLAGLLARGRLRAR
ncbi:MAG: hypothetical protein N2109_06465 [Fimbriimonadales bacterium]|nr:hypothetical protein [Fimbriimonadales bacterium]